MATLEIVQAELEHLDVVTPLFDAYRVFYKQPSDPVAARAFIEERLRQGESTVFLALVDGVGSGMAQLYPTFSSVMMRRVWVLNDLFVAPHVRGQGVGEALLRHSEQWAAALGAARLDLKTATDNTTAQRLYERMGWQREIAFYGYSLLVDAAR